MITSTDPSITGIKLLMHAILMRTIDDLNLAEQGRRGPKAKDPPKSRHDYHADEARKRVKYRSDARRWFLGEDSGHVFSFPYICRELGLSESCVREKIGMGNEAA